MPIVLLRVDERLIHGQVVVGWGEQLHTDRIVVVDDEISDSAWEQELYCLGVPPAVEASFVSVTAARELLPHWKQDDRRRIVLLRDVDALERLAVGGALEGVEVNLGGIHSAPGRERVLPYLYLNSEDRERLRRISAGGATITARDLPSSRAVPVDQLVGEQR